MGASAGREAFQINRLRKPRRAWLPWGVTGCCFAVCFFLLYRLAVLLLSTQFVHPSSPFGGGRLIDWFGPDWRVHCGSISQFLERGFS